MGSGKFCNQAHCPKFYLDMKMKDLLMFGLGRGRCKREYEVLPQLLLKEFYGKVWLTCVLKHVEDVRLGRRDVFCH